MKRILILMGKSASGKDSIARYLIDNYNFTPIISETTRPMREGEVNGRDYNFITDSEFDSLEFIEKREYNTLLNNVPNVWKYGIKKQELDPNTQYVVILDVDGMNSFLDYFGKENCYVVNVMATQKTREHRARLRGGFDKTEWDRRAKSDNLIFNPYIYSNKIIWNEDISLKSICSDITNDLIIERDIFVDIDGVLLKSCQCICDMYNDKYNTDFKGSDIYTWDFKELGLNETIVEQMFDDPIFFQYVEWVNGAKEFLNKYRDRIVLVSKCSLDNYINKRLFFDNNGYSDIPIIPLTVSKRYINMSNGIFIDDCVKNLYESNAKRKILFKEYSGEREWNMGWGGEERGEWEF